MKKNIKNIIIIGGGAAGLLAANFAAQDNYKVIVLEKNNQTGKKLLATGGGHCNLTNLKPYREWAELFGRQGRFINPSLEFFDQDKMVSFFNNLGMQTIIKDNFYLYPASNSAKSVRDVLLDSAQKKQVKFIYNCNIQQLIITNQKITAIQTEQGLIESDAVILTTGGYSYPLLGSDGSGYKLLENTGHKITNLFPGLVGISIYNLTDNLAGIILPNVELSLKLKNQPRQVGYGELLFTHQGISGPAVLDISASINQALSKSKTISLNINLLRNFTPEKWQEIIANWRKNFGEQYTLNLLKQYLPTRLINYIEKNHNLNLNQPVSQLNKIDAEILTKLLTNYQLIAIEKNSWHKAMITRGGVDLKHVDPFTLKSKLIDNLFFAGEVLDIDGPCGGYNLHWAFASGALAGSNVINYI